MKQFMWWIILLMPVFLFTGCNETPTPSPGVIGTRIGNEWEQTDSVNIVIDSVQVHRLPEDLLDGNDAEMQLMVFWSDGRDLNRFSSYFGDHPVLAYAGSEFENLGVGHVGFDPNQTYGDVYVWFLAVDSDDQNFLVDFLADDVLDEFSEKVGGWIANGIGFASAGNPATFLVNALVDLAYEFVGESDLIGQHAFELKRGEDWNGGQYVVTTEDGALSFTFRIEVTQNREPTGTRIATSINRTLIPRTESPPQALRGALNGTVDTARLNLRQSDSDGAPILFRMSQYDPVRVLGRNLEGTWLLVDVGIVGWASTRYIVVEGTINDLPIYSEGAPFPEPVMPIRFVCPGANGPSFSIGDRFVVPFGDNSSGVFANPGAEPVVGHIPEGGGGWVLGGPVCAVAPEHRYLIWYYVEADNGLRGYMNESFSETPIKAIVPE